VPQYRFSGPTPVSIPAMGLELQPGDKFDSDEKINHSDFEVIKVEKPAEKPAKES
jgi:hypothetical protein